MTSDKFSNEAFGWITCPCARVVITKFPHLQNSTGSTPQSPPQSLHVPALFFEAWPRCLGLQLCIEPIAGKVLTVGVSQIVLHVRSSSCTTSTNPHIKNITAQIYTIDCLDDTRSGTWGTYSIAAMRSIMATAREITKHVNIVPTRSLKQSSRE